MIDAGLLKPRKKDSCNLAGLTSSDSRRVHFFLLFPLFFFCCIPLFPQLPRLQFQHVTMEQSLSHPAVFEICEDSTGFMWFGALAGLSRFDGKEIKSINSATVHALHTDRNRDVWVGTGHTGLACINISRDTIVQYTSVSSDEKTLSGWGGRTTLSDHSRTPSTSCWTKCQFAQQVSSYLPRPVPMLFIGKSFFRGRFVFQPPSQYQVITFLTIFPTVGRSEDDVPDHRSLFLSPVRFSPSSKNYGGWLCLYFI